MSSREQLAEWIGTAACVIIALTWAATLRWIGRIHTRRSCVKFLDGCLWFVHNYPRPWRAVVWSVRPSCSSFRERLGLCLPEVEIAGTYWLAGVPLWMLFVVSGVPSVILWRRDRRGLGPGHRRRCGYDLTGAEHEKSLECGTSCGDDVPNRQ